MKVTGKKAEESALESYWGGDGQGTMASVLLQPLFALLGAVVLLQADALVA